MSKLTIKVHEAKARKIHEGYDGRLVFKTDTLLSSVKEGGSTKDYETPCKGEFESIDDAIIFASKKIGIRPDPSAWFIYDVDYTNYYVTVCYTADNVSYGIEIGCYTYTPADEKDIDTALAGCTAKKA